MKVYDDYLRWLYRGRRSHWFARLRNRASALAFGACIWPRRVAALDVRGRHSGRAVTLPSSSPTWVESATWSPCWASVPGGWPTSGPTTVGLWSGMDVEKRSVWRRSPSATGLPSSGAISRWHREPDPISLLTAAPHRGVRTRRSDSPGVPHRRQCGGDHVTQHVRSGRPTPSTDPLRGIVHLQVSEGGRSHHAPQVRMPTSGAATDAEVFSERSREGSLVARVGRVRLCHPQQRGASYRPGHPTASPPRAAHPGEWPWGG